MRIFKLTSSNRQEVISQTLAVLKSSGLVVFPSDTVYGLLADSQNPEAVSNLLEFKERKPGQAISIFVADKEMAEKHVILNQNASNIFENLLPGPFTVICESKGQTDPRLEAENKTLGIRLPDFPLIIELVKKFGRPLTATSANLSGKPSVYSIPALLKTLSHAKKERLGLVVDAGKLPPNKPSTVIDTTTGQLKTLRAGDLLPETPNSLISNSEEETDKFAQFMATKFIKKMPGKAIIFMLEGPLGAGKTVFAKGLAKALKIKETVTSPTFNICNEYVFRKNPQDNTSLITSDMESHCQSNSKINKNVSFKFIHCDFYRLEAKQEFEELDFFKEVCCGNVFVVEWPERIPAEIISALKNSAEIVYLRIKYSGENQRVIEWGKSAR
ncbi:threonylcarbamoyl-AMP synthase [Candidatus Microgenomates bacterium]|jgi:L-threonylcarbamoyladenylate synthase|nr:MAG: threonylcarbamoyl-AMP synthase [Candidatus Microgenomates bacterium]